MVKFARLNLIEAWPRKGLFDVILCVGHAESLSGFAHEPEQLQPADCRKPQAAS